MLYAILGLVGFLSLSFGQTCQYSLSDRYNSSTGSNYYVRGYGQYVVYDFAKSGNSKGEYFLPYLFTETDKTTLACHNHEFTSALSINFECSTGYTTEATDSTIVTARTYNGGSCAGTATSSVWWQKGYSPYYDENGDVADCSDVASCEAINATRSTVTSGSGSRFDFSCDGDVEYVTATLCVGDTDKTCNDATCATVSASLGGACIGTPNATYSNLLVSCDNKYGYLNTYVDLVQFQAQNMWNDYTVDRSCVNNGQTGYVCGVFSIGTECDVIFTTQTGGNDVNVTGMMTTCTDPFRTLDDDDSSNLAGYSISVLLITAFVAALKF